MPDIIQYEFNISMRLMKDFLESESAWPLIEGSSSSKPALGLVDRGQQMMQGVPWVPQYFTEHPLIR